jgi:hypothetical protein
VRVGLAHRLEVGARGLVGGVAAAPQDRRRAGGIGGHALAGAEVGGGPDAGADLVALAGPVVAVDLADHAPRHRRVVARAELVVADQPARPVGDASELGVVLERRWAVGAVGEGGVLAGVGVAGPAQPLG